MPGQKTTGEEKKRHKIIERAKEPERGRKGRVGKRNEGGKPTSMQIKAFLSSPANMT